MTGRKPAESWAEKYVDGQVDQAWLALRMELADRFESGLEAGEMPTVEITTTDGRTVVADVCDDHVAVIAGDQMVVTSNVDEAAYEVVEILRGAWEVIHPLFLDTDLVDVPTIDDNPTPAVVVPVLGRAESRDELQAWVEAAFQERLDEPLKVARTGVIWWRTRGGGSVSVKVWNAGRIELRATLARQVGFGKAHRMIDRLSRESFGLKFHLVQDTLVMSQIVIATPFAPEQLHHALNTFCVDVDRLDWVAEKVLRKRVKVERAKVAEAEAAKAAAEEELAKARARIAELEASRARARQRGLESTRRRMAVEKELAALKADIEALLSSRREKRQDGAA